MNRFWLKYSLFIGLLLHFNIGFGHELNLNNIEQKAIDSAPELAALRHKEDSLRQTAIAEGQLPDPKFQAGLINVPTDTFSLTQENMTQIQLGLTQAFPEGRSLSIKTKQHQRLADAEHQRSLEMRADILRIVRQEWFNLYYWLQSAKIVEENRQVFSHLVKVTESILASGRSNQHDVIRAQLELSRIENRLIQITEQIDSSRARLARWVGSDTATRSNPTHLPNYPIPPDRNALSEQIQQHPYLQTEMSLVSANQQGVLLAKQKYKPGWTFGLNYSFRQGDNPMNGDRRADFIGATVNVDLPIFPGKRQSKQVAASVETLNASQENVHVKHRQIVSQIEEQWTKWKQLTAQAKHYQQKLIPEAKQYSIATLTAYQNDLSDFPTVARAQVAELNTQLEGLKIDVELMNARVELLYFEGADV